MALTHFSHWKTVVIECYIYTPYCSPSARAQRSQRLTLSTCCLILQFVGFLDTGTRPSVCNRRCGWLRAFISVTMRPNSSRSTRCRVNTATLPFLQPPFEFPQLHFSPLHFVYFYFSPPFRAPDQTPASVISAEQRLRTSSAFHITFL